MKIRKAVFPVAGLGTRVLPATKAMPKEMLTIVDRPLIQYVVDEAREAGVEHFVFVTGGACSKREADYLRSSGCATLLKPVDIKDIWAALAAPHPRASQTPEALATLRSDAPESKRTSGIPTQPPG